jgi:hypothetical protein
MANKANPTSGYARSIYHKLTGERIYLDHQYEDRSRNAKTNTAAVKEEISIFPNPTMDEYITVSLDVKESTTGYSANLYNMVGEIIEIKVLNSGNNIIDLGDNSNILFVIIYKDGEVVKTEKLLRL